MRSRRAGSDHPAGRDREPGRLLDELYACATQHQAPGRSDGYFPLLDQPPELVLGDVFDDLRDVRSEAGAPEEEAVIFWHAFHHLSGLMLFLANADMQGDLVAASAEGDVR